MTPRTLATSALAVLLVPVSFGALFWRGSLRARDLAVGFDPFEIDLELYARNDD